MNKNSKTGLILSHIFVREREEHKWDWIQNSIDKHRQLYDNFYIVLSGHGIEVPEHIKDQLDSIYWEEQIREQDIGQGHPHFCIKGYEACLEANCQYTLKTRGFDWLEHDEVLKNNLVFCSTNTDFSKKQLGDLLIFGDTKDMLDLWSCVPWDYTLIDGLENLYKNMKNKWGESWLQDNAKFLSSQQMGWMTMNDFKGNGPKYWGI